jgi:hypothetical protein
MAVQVGMPLSRERSGRTTPRTRPWARAITITVLVKVMRLSPDTFKVIDHLGELLQKVVARVSRIGEMDLQMCVVLR